MSGFEMTYYFTRLILVFFWCRSAVTVSIWLMIQMLQSFPVLKGLSARWTWYPINFSICFNNSSAIFIFHKTSIIWICSHNNAPGKLKLNKTFLFI